MAFYAIYQTDNHRLLNWQGFASDKAGESSIEISSLTNEEFSAIATALNDGDFYWRVNITTDEDGTQTYAGVSITTDAKPNPEVKAQATITGRLFQTNEFFKAIPTADALPSRPRNSFDGVNAVAYSHGWVSMGQDLAVPANHKVVCARVWQRFDEVKKQWVECHSAVYDSTHWQMGAGKTTFGAAGAYNRNHPHIRFNVGTAQAPKWSPAVKNAFEEKIKVAAIEILPSHIGNDLIVKVEPVSLPDVDKIVGKMSFHTGTSGEHLHSTRQHIWEDSENVAHVAHGTAKSAATAFHADMSNMVLGTPPDWATQPHNSYKWRFQRNGTEVPAEFANEVCIYDIVLGTGVTKAHFHLEVE